MISVYMPAECAPPHFSDYLNTLGDSQQCDNIVLAGDFNVDFDRGGSLADTLLDFISDLDLVASDLSYHNSPMKGTMVLLGSYHMFSGVIPIYD